MGYGGPMNSSDTDFFGFAFHHKGGQTHQSQAGDYDGQNGEQDGEPGEVGFIAVKGVEFLIQK